ncbi:MULTISPECIES: MBL fold metallo-hydrolase [Aneurinibacillus]|uniref:Glyoxylase, beta-lactamase superfamily II n=1 Tax=Aneurinibacillus thermoaerophilus TaxID=143495 RepID=A0A1G7YLE0_ANETH|nr:MULTISPECIES: MBL fold metallo-hydrolase [Aneurinibacillus]AMA73817.1 hypothetical protein ACH33_13765 [Aneurinibacillus sp. XH2]MED0676651.1 MBL fold metallo-hydrolase [Aneurinibacillus thermoaerophilus]MED0679362.1 MBL fold metallo-hydrolase [Aneurinibacillus thermoaerophilus]MED0738067.1 MBL fold metallo-hydrolase [Aneurinibacillus thermoaerophilus]MED0756488.1 MBL fold metallo-hydrolase [Aneurinibacillus thermoaerophilus]
MQKAVNTQVFRLEIPTPFSVGAVNIFLIKGESCTLVDVGPKTREAREALRVFLKENGLTWRNIDQIFLTHQHVDHSGLVAEVAERTDAQVIAHPNAVPYIEGEETFMRHHDAFFRELYEENGVPEQLLGHVERFQKMLNMYSDPAPVHRIVRGGELLGSCGEWRIIFTPGHTQTHLALYREADGLMLSGDFLIKEISSNAFVEPPARAGEEREKPLVVYRRAMQEVKMMPVRRMLPAHGEEIEKPSELIVYRLRRQEERAEKIYGLLADGAKHVFELSALLFPSIYIKELPLTFSETLGHLDLLIEQGKVERVWSEEKNVYLYRTKEWAR